MGVTFTTLVLVEEDEEELLDSLGTTTILVLAMLLETVEPMLLEMVENPARAAFAASFMPLADIVTSSSKPSATSLFWR